MVFASAAVAAACSDSDSSGDARAKALSYAREDISCTISEDCCAVLDGCLARFLIVSSEDRATVEDLIASADDDACVGCIQPIVQVDCVSGKCEAVELEPTGDASYDVLPMGLRDTHCGKVDVPPGWVEKSEADAPTEPKSLRPRTVIGC